MRIKAVLVNVSPPLLASMIKRTLARVDAAVVAEIVNLEHCDKVLQGLEPDVVIIGPHAAGSQVSMPALRRLAPDALVLAVSADLTQLLGPGPDDSTPFTSKALAERIRPRT
jgi:hypothetical protein